MYYTDCQLIPYLLFERFVEKCANWRAHRGNDTLGVEMAKSWRAKLAATDGRLVMLVGETKAGELNSPLRTAG